MWFRIPAAALALMAAFAGAPPPAQAQAAQIWSCEEGIRDLTGRLPTVLWRYQMALWANGMFQDQGVMLSAGMQYGMQAQGQWQIQGTLFRKTGTRVDGPQGTMPYELYLTRVGEQHMHDTTQQGNSVFAAQCSRVQ